MIFKPHSTATTVKTTRHLTIGLAADRIQDKPSTHWTKDGKTVKLGR